MISYEATCKLFTYLNVLPAVIDLLRAFGEKTGYEDESYSEFVFRESENTTGEGSKSYCVTLSRRQ